MRKTPALTTAQLIEARRLIVRSGRRNALALPEPTPAAPDGATGDSALRIAPTNDPRHARWQPTEWSETAFEPRS